MGCDIHSYAETRSEDGTWAVVGDVFPLDTWDRQHFKRDDGPHPFSTRNYGLFALLAGVRNYAAIEPISVPKGMPEDASPEVRAEYERWKSDAHSVSWLGLDELLEAQDAFLAQTDLLGEADRLAQLGALGQPSQVRVVFWFDN